MTQARIKHKTICQLTSPMSDKPSDIFRMLLLEEKRKKEKKKEKEKEKEKEKKVVNKSVPENWSR